ncbi:MAG: P-loop NTPase [Candidatus Diapherotrites archaeon]|uniref:Iron-sulfur cluster carrier protein n=1 Tax=Candidatus Iainarchaeum sp. TaxID=3101447 RepID=A0A8T4L249_9ARCH|nr:P-loop NTPase [Candidatus Diapherotrites archaeon]
MTDTVPAANPFASRLDEQKKRISDNLSMVKKVIAVGSGKGGVGKTFVAINLAWTLARKGKKVGLLDADIDCPNVFVALGISDQLEASDEGKILPVPIDGIQVVSMAGLSEDPEQPRIWRGPMIGKAVSDFLSKVEWSELDVLIIDLPPGTSDAALTLMQSVDLAGFVIVSTNAPSAVLDAKKAFLMAKEMNKPVTGFVENMRSDMFGREKVEDLAAEVGAPFLGAIELEKAVQQALEENRPVTAIDPKLRIAFESIAEKVWSELTVEDKRDENPHEE